MRVPLLAALVLAGAGCGDHQRGPSTGITKTPAQKNWQTQAIAHLRLRGQPIRLSDLAPGKTPLCLRLVNYGCLKQPTNDTWNGSVGRDARNHAIFRDGRWGIRAVVVNICHYRKQGPLSIARLVSTYQPWCDTIGSRATRRGWRKSCKRFGSNGDVAAWKRGEKVCARPPNGRPRPGQCAACNCPNTAISNMVAYLRSKGRKVTADQPLPFFRPDGRTNRSLMKHVLHNKIRRELGRRWSPKPALLTAGMDLADRRRCDFKAK